MLGRFESSLYLGVVVIGLGFWITHCFMLIRKKYYSNKETYLKRKRFILTFFFTSLTLAFITVVSSPTLRKVLDVNPDITFFITCSLLYGSIWIVLIACSNAKRAHSFNILGTLPWIPALFSPPCLIALIFKWPIGGVVATALGLTGIYYFSYGAYLLTVMSGKVSEKIGWTIVVLSLLLVSSPLVLGAFLI
jgi:hypothetical protein